MEKINVNGKEIEFDENYLKPLSDEELESATGGLILRDGCLVVYRRVCVGCGAKSPYYTLEDHYAPEAREFKHNEPCNETRTIEEVRGFSAGY
jgi:hypothetical protein